MDFINEKIQEAYEKSIFGIEENIDIDEKESINEASQVDFKEIDDSKKKLIQDLIGKKEAEKQTYFSGIHGDIASLRSNISGTDAIRVNKKDLKRILNDKNVRWVDIKSIGF